jgi:hypothetical protein
MYVCKVHLFYEAGYVVISVGNLTEEMFCVSMFKYATTGWTG